MGTLIHKYKKMFPMFKPPIGSSNMVSSVHSSPTQRPGWAKALMGAGESPAGYLGVARPKPASPGLRLAPSKKSVVPRDSKLRFRCHSQVLNTTKKKEETNDGPKNNNLIHLTRLPSRHLPHSRAFTRNGPLST
jgi:hypothetical protein